VGRLKLSSTNTRANSTTGWFFFILLYLVLWRSHSWRGLSMGLSDCNCTAQRNQNDKFLPRDADA